jgi:hypothetical protein
MMCLLKCVRVAFGSRQLIFSSFDARQLCLAFASENISYHFDFRKLAIWLSISHQIRKYNVVKDLNYPSIFRDGAVCSVSLYVPLSLCLSLKRYIFFPSYTGKLFKPLTKEKGPTFNMR